MQEEIQLTLKDHVYLSEASLWLSQFCFFKQGQNIFGLFVTRRLMHINML